MTSKLVHNGADRVRIEVEIDGKTSVMELRATDGEYVQLTLALDAETVELPPDNPGTGDRRRAATPDPLGSVRQGPARGHPYCLRLTRSKPADTHSHHS